MGLAAGRPSPAGDREPAAEGVELLDALLPARAVGGFTTRRGGSSAPPWDGLDLALHVGDEPGHVAANRAQLRRRLGADGLVLADQVHGPDVAVVGARDAEGAAGAPSGRAVPAVDALVTAEPGVALVVLAADCLPVLLVDPAAGVVAAAHAGRSGLVAGVLLRTLEAMQALGASPQGTTAVLGPAVCGACYELPAALADDVERAVPGSRSTTRTGTAAVDLSAGAQAQLARAGVAEVRRAGGCTVEQPDRFFSYRRDGVTGRHAGAVLLRP